MSTIFHKRNKARKDLADTFRYYVREAGLPVARRFSFEVNSTLVKLANMPNMGTMYDHSKELRFFPVQASKNI